MKKINGRFFGADILSVKQFTQADLEIVFENALYFQKGIEKGMVFNELRGKIMAALFYEPSSRTFSSFLAAMQRLGGGIIPYAGMTQSSVSKGESLEDTVSTFANYADVLVIRHAISGTAEKAARAVPVPVVNAGDGTGEHPTQALLDLYTIKERLGRLDNLTIAMVGDLRYGRTVHSLSKLISLFSKIEVELVSPEASPMPEEIVSLIKKRGVKVKKQTSLFEIIGKVDVLYMTRVQKERMDADTYAKIKDVFKLDENLVKKMKKKALIMHPLPRIGEITKEVDRDPRACYLRYQMQNGMFVRMALLKLILRN